MTSEGVSPVPREARVYQSQPAGIVSRTLANVVDGAVVAGILALCYLGVNGLRFMFDPRDFQFSGTSLLLSLTAGMLLLGLYFTIAWSVTGRTYGGHVMGLRVVTRSGRRVRVVPALLRAVLCVLFPIGLVWCAWSRDRRSIQDIVAHTAVVYDWLPHHVPALGSPGGSPAAGEHTEAAPGAS